MNNSKNQPLFYNKHVFCCTNSREPESKRSSCGGCGSEKLQNYMKVRCKELGLKDIRINKAGCLDRCELGPVMVIYPEGVWYTYKNKEDIEEIIESHLQKNEIVKRLECKNT